MVRGSGFVSSALALEGARASSNAGRTASSAWRRKGCMMDMGPTSFEYRWCGRILRAIRTSGPPDRSRLPLTASFLDVATPVLRGLVVGVVGLFGVLALHLDPLDRQRPAGLRVDLGQCAAEPHVAGGDVERHRH